MSNDALKIVIFIVFEK